MFYFSAELIGQTNEEMAQCEVVLDTWLDIGIDIGPLWQEKDEAKKVGIH